MSPMPQIDFQLFGYPEIHVDGRAVALPLRKALAALVYVAEAQTPVSRDAVATLLWPEADEATARSRLRRLLHRMHQLLGIAIVASDRLMLCIAPGIELRVDTQAFEQACTNGNFAEATRIYRADFLGTFAVEGCPDFDDWAFYRREALRSRFIHAIERLIEAMRLRGEHGEMIVHAQRFVAFDPLSETAHHHLISACRLAGDETAAQRHCESYALLLQKELGVLPGPAILALMNTPTPVAGATTVSTCYANSDGVHIAFQVIGSGPPDMVFLPGFVTHVERMWGEPCARAFLTALSSIGRVMIFDRRGVGLSDRIGATPGVEATAKDIGTVMTAVGSRKAILIGSSEGGPGCIHFAATSPERVQGLILCGCLAKGSQASDYPFALTTAQFETWLRQLIAQWGGPAGMDVFAPSLAGNRAAESWWAGLLRSASSPGAVKGVLEAMRDMDVRSLLPRIVAPTLVLHRTGDRAVRIEAGRDLAASISKARFVELPGNDHWIWVGDQVDVIEEIRTFIRTVAQGAGSAAKSVDLTHPKNR
jgi:DNA-binding SARP family transcriptional activator/pimeloyl-ACP methyl ester carboxylesterase